MIKAACLPVLALALTAASAARQTPRQTPPPAVTPAPQFASGIDLVEVDVSVTTKNGDPVTDLTAADFTIHEDGVEQAIQAIYLTSVDRAVLRPAAAAANNAPLPERRELKQRVFVFLLDMTHLSASGFTRSRDAITAFIKDGASPADLIGIVANGQMLGNRIGADRPALLAALAQVKGPNLSKFSDMHAFPRLIDDTEAERIAQNDERTLDTAVARACGEQPGECRGAGGDGQVRNQLVAKAAHLTAEITRDTSLTMSALQSLASGLGRIPGPKQVVVFSEGFYAVDASAWLKSVNGLASRNGVHFSTFDARGTNRDLRSQSFLEATPVTSVDDRTSLDSDANADVLTSLALDTGGDRAFNYNNFREPLEKLQRETGTYYVIGYRPAKAFDGSYRKLEVKVQRAEVVVRARRGYMSVRGPAGDMRPATTAEATPVSSLTLATGRSGIGLARTDSAELVSRPDSVNLVTALEHAPVRASSSSIAPASSEASALAQAGWRLFADGHAEEAREQLAKAAAAAPRTPWIQYALGQTEFTLQHMDAAATAFETVRRALPEYEPVYFDLADSYLQLRRLSDALAVLREAAKRWPADPETHLAVGCVLVGRGALDDAIGEFDRAVTLAPDSGTAYFNLARAYHLSYLHMLRSSSTNQKATSMLADRIRQQAIEAYQKYLTIGGPFEQDARQSLANLGWK